MYPFSIKKFLKFSNNDETFNIMVAVKAKMKKVNSTEELVSRINACESDLRKKNPDIHWVFFEPDVEK